MNIPNLFTAIGIMSFIITGGLILAYFTQKYIFSEPKIKKLEMPKEKQEVVPCTGCKCYINKSDASVVKVVVGIYMSYFSGGGDSKNYYCKKCNPPYEKEVYTLSEGIKYYKEFEVDINGKLIK